MSSESTALGSTTPAVNNIKMSKQDITLTVPELYDPSYLDVLIPVTHIEKAAPAAEQAATPAPSNPMMDALKSTSDQTYTANTAPTYSSTGSPTLDAFQKIGGHSYSKDMNNLLHDSWREDPNLTLRIIWNLRSIHDGKGEKEAFYRAYGWLLDNHPRTAVQNLHYLVSPVCTTKNSEDAGMAHGYWKDLLNVLGLATTNELSNIETAAIFLHDPRPQSKRRRGTKRQKIWHVTKEDGAVVSKKRHDVLVEKLKEPVYRALFVTVARLFAQQLVKDLATFNKYKDMYADDEDARFEVLKQISLAAKWAPTPQGQHDRHTNISTAIAFLLHDMQAPVAAFPSILKTEPHDSKEVAFAMRCFYQRWVLTPLREATHIVESRMSTNRWKEIKYSRVPSVSMKNNTPHFFKHDPHGFEQYLLGVESGKRKISGATLMPHEIVGQIIALANEKTYAPPTGDGAKVDPMKQVKAKLAETELRVAESQWKSLVQKLRDAGTIENSIAICDVSGSMGYLSGRCDKKNPQPIFPAVALSLVLASLAQPPFNGGFITFSNNPEFVQLDLDKPLNESLQRMISSSWAMNTDLQAVFCKLLLPLAKKNKVKKEDMIKRLFIFSDMQFDAGTRTRNDKADWTTNYDVIKREYEKAGYDVPEIVYWDLAAYGTVDAKAETKGVAMMNGFSPAMLKVFMGEQDEEEEAEEWMEVEEGGEGEVKKVEKEKEEFNPVSVMKKALGKKSYEGLVVVD